MFGAVFHHELLRAGRRTRVPLLARVYSAWLVLQFATLAAAHWAVQPASGLAAAASLTDFIRGFVGFFVIQHVALLAVVTPIMAAAALADERDRGTMGVLLTTPLGAATLVGGKLLARFVEAATLALIGLPLLCLVGGLGRLGLGVVVATMALTLALVLALTSVTILVSVWRPGRKTTLLTAYATLIVAVVAWLSAHLVVAPTLAARWKAYPTWTDAVGRADLVLACANPVFVLDPAWQAPDAVDLTARLAAGAAAFTLAAGVCAGVAAWRLRPAFQQAGAPRRGLVRRQARRTRRLRGDAVYWRERLGERPGRRLGAAVAALGLGWLVSSWASAVGGPEVFLIAGLVGLLLGALATAIRASGSISGERERRSWESLLLTEIDTEDLTPGKARAAVRAGAWLAVPYSAPVLVAAARQGPLELLAVALTSLMTWAALGYMAANGLWWSASSRGSWQSMLGAVVSGYAVCFAVAGLTSFLAVGAACALGPAALFFLIVLGPDTAYAAAVVCVSLLTSLGAVWLLLRAGHAQLDKANYWIDARERAGKTLVRVLARALAGGAPLMPAARGRTGPGLAQPAVTR